MAIGSPQPEGSGLPELMSEGMDERVKNQMEIASEVHSVA